MSLRPVSKSPSPVIHAYARRKACERAQAISRSNMRPRSTVPRRTVVAPAPVSAPKPFKTIVHRVDYQRSALSQTTYLPAMGSTTDQAWRRDWNTTTYHHDFDLRTPTHKVNRFGSTTLPRKATIQGPRIDAPVATTYATEESPPPAKVLRYDDSTTHRSDFKPPSEEAMLVAAMDRQLGRDRSLEDSRKGAPIPLTCFPPLITTNQDASKSVCAANRRLKEQIRLRDRKAMLTTIRKHADRVAPGVSDFDSLPDDQLLSLALTAEDMQ